MEQELTADQQRDLTRSQAQQLLDSATEVRAVPLPAAVAGPEALHRALVQARGNLDRLEYVLTTAIALRDAAQLEARRLEQIADDAWDDQATAPRGAGSRYEYEGAQERYATWRVKVRAQRNAARAARDCADILVSAERVIAAMYRGLDGTRLDLHKRLSALAFESSLDR